MTDNHASTPPLSFFTIQSNVNKRAQVFLFARIFYNITFTFTGRMPFLPPNQQRQSTEFDLIPS